MDTATSPRFLERLKDKLPKLPLYVWLFIFILVLAIFSVGLYALISPTFSLKSLLERKGVTQEDQNIWEPYVPSPVPLAHGRQTYRISGGTQGLPTISEAVLDPEDPEMGSTQTISVKANYDSAIKEVSAVLHTDDKDTTQVLQLSSGSPTNGEWKGSWKVENSFDRSYSITVRAKNEQSLVQSVTITLR